MALQADHVDLVAFGCGLAGQPPADVAVDELGIFGRHQVAQLAADQLDAVHADETSKLAVGVQNDIAMDEHRFIDTVAQLAEQLRHCGARLAVADGGSACQQMIDRGGERGNFRTVGLQFQAPGEPAANGDPLQLLRELLDAVQGATLQPVKHEDDARDQREQEAQQP